MRALPARRTSNDCVNTCMEVRLRPSLSFSVANYSSAVNVKLEKTGGFRAAVKAVEAARAASMKVWVGMMVGSLLLSSMPAHLMPLTDIGGDLDGVALRGGVSWAAASRSSGSRGG